MTIKGKKKAAKALVNMYDLSDNALLVVFIYNVHNELTAIRKLARISFNLEL